jgi:4a-hydroxytetrahydrobiopterin dehydratase
MRPTLNSEQRKSIVAECPNWEVLSTRDAIFRSIFFKDFAQAFDCMQKIAAVAEELNHHPEWFNVWNRLDITLSTHDSQGLTLLDIELAKAINSICEDLITK